MFVRIFTISVAFMLGFLAHALYFPDVFSNGITDIKQLAIPNAISPTSTAGKVDPLMTKITFDGEHFNRQNITVPFSRYLRITNQSQNKLMWLTANTPILSTPRGYGYDEALEVRMDKKGQFIVADKNNPQEKLVITVR